MIGVTVPTLESARLRLVALDPKYFDAFAAFFASERSRFVGGPATREQAWRFLAGEIGHWTMRGYGRFAVELHDGTFAGVVGAWNPGGWPEPEIGWELMEGHEGKGYATEAALRVREWLYTERGWTTAISLIDPKNYGSKGVAARLGAAYESDWHHERYGRVEIWRHPGPHA
ncbi:MAG: GNAT family N-acetyltransferase [Pseudomonadota bacterium]